jgi:hypothetical protein
MYINSTRKLQINVNPEHFLHTRRLCAQKSKIFVRKVLRSVYGPVQDSNNEWRVRTNQEIEALMKEENIVRFIKSQRLA